MKLATRSLSIVLALGVLGMFRGATAQHSDQAPERVVSMAPSITEIVFALDAADRLVGVTDFCRYPPAALEIKRTGGWDNPNLEVLTALQPDVIFIQGRHEKLRAYAAERGARLEPVDMDSVATIREGIVRIGEVIGAEAAATSLTLKIDERLEAVARSVPTRGADGHRPRVFISVGRQPGSLDQLFTVSGKSFLGESVALAGGENIFADIEQAYPQASKESLVARRPEVIIELQGRNDLSQDDRQRLIDDWRRLPSLPAVRDRRIHVIAADHAMIPGPRFVATIELMRDALWPREAAAETQ